MRLKVVVQGNLVSRSHLRREARVVVTVRDGDESGTRQVGFVGVSLGIEVVVDSGPVLTDQRRSVRRIEPDSVPDQAAPNRGVEVPQLLQPGDVLDPARAKVVVQVAGRQPAARIRREQIATEGVAAILWNDVRPDARKLLLGIPAAGLHADFLHARLVVVEGRRCAAGSAAHPVGETVDAGRLLDGSASVHRDRKLLAAHRIPKTERDRARQQSRERGRDARGRQRIDDFLGDDRASGGAADVHERTLPRHRDRFLERTHLHVGVECGGEGRRQIDPFPAHRTETTEGEGHRVGAGPQIDDTVDALPVGHGRTALLDEHRARCLYGDAGQHGARRVANGPGDRALCGRHRWRQPEHD